MKTPTLAVQSGMIDMESNTTLVQCYPAHQAAPVGEGPFPAALVLHDRFGLTPHVRNVTNRLAHAGFYTLAPDLYATPASAASSAPEFLYPTTATWFSYSDDMAARERASSLADERAMAIVRQAIAYVAGRSKAKSGGVCVVGFGSGGRWAFLSACAFSEDVRAASCFAPLALDSPCRGGPGQVAPLDRLAKLETPLLLFYGRLDMDIRQPERDAVRQRLTELGKNFSIEVFPEAGCDFFCEERDTYRIHASKVAWEETLALFRRQTAAPTAS